LNDFHKRRTEYGTKVNLKMEECIRVVPPPPIAYVRSDILTDLKYKGNCNGHWERNN
jgi:hypothetical protein